ncbi:lactate racemase domain-containing protein [Halalkalicoccus sp. NIPERK01]|uniref:lactate racemase domain-containing protein n=1 Tax=Halalkalicoccus sp. NIPERK01 TaxID=3053469 RepID=UPI00256EB6A4|nr:lactate racemase domain-containing protein [Halalkalicoccus sp. NIPERK01]MDL5363777.1 lactate racemase domain-containing protein [Halalkalicoccus sp. NIPERK01]
MEFPDTRTVEATLDPVEFPRFAAVEYDPPTPEVADPVAAAREALDALPLGPPKTGKRIAVGVGSRGIHDLVPVTRAVVSELEERGFDPVIVPAMGSHGGATAEGQRETLAALGVTEQGVECRIDARMDVMEVGETEREPVYLSRAAHEADAVLVVNRVKPHTNFTGEIESGLCKMLAVGLGKHRGAQAVHRDALSRGYVPAITEALDEIREEVRVLGGIALVENSEDRTEHIEGVPAEALPNREGELLERAREYMPTLPFSDLDVLVVDRIGKDVSGTGMDTNVIGRYEVLNADDPSEPDIDRIVVRGLTEATHGNGQGIGLADLTTTSVIESLDLGQVYTNALTSGSLSKARLPVALPTDELALTAALSSIGSYDPETVRVAWIRDTGHLSSFRVSKALVEDQVEHLSVTGDERLRFEEGTPRFDPVEG